MCNGNRPEVILGPSNLVIKVKLCIAGEAAKHVGSDALICSDETRKLGNRKKKKKQIHFPHLNLVIFCPSFFHLFHTGFSDWY